MNAAVFNPSEDWELKFPHGEFTCMPCSWPGHEQGMQVNSPWGNFSSQSSLGLNTAAFMMQDSSGTALSSAGLPASLDVNNWDSHYVDLGYVWTPSDGPDL